MFKNKNIAALLESVAEKLSWLDIAGVTEFGVLSKNLHSGILTLRPGIHTRICGGDEIRSSVSLLDDDFRELFRFEESHTRCCVDPSEKGTPQPILAKSLLEYSELENAKMLLVHISRTILADEEKETESEVDFSLLHIFLINQESIREYCEKVIAEEKLLEGSIRELEQLLGEIPRFPRSLSGVIVVAKRSDN